MTTENNMVKSFKITLNSVGTEANNNPAPAAPKAAGNRYKRKIVSIIAYLLGIRKSIFENENEPPELECYEALERNKHARIIRNLCLLRTTVERNYHNILEAVRFGINTMTSLNGLLPLDVMEQLEKDGVKVFRNLDNPCNFVIMLNSYIKERIGNCQDLFPDWISWKYISDLFIMPNGNTYEGTKKAAEFYYQNMPFYPYQHYLNWPARDEGNILYNDEKFVTLLYKWNNAEFPHNNGLISDVSGYVKGNVRAFISGSRKCDVIVDCENSDPYNLCAALKSLGKDNLGRINRIVLYDDKNASSAWEKLEEYLDIPVEYILIERIKENKSLTDVRLTTRLCKEFYMDNVGSFILVSSDSDYWGMMQELPDAEFLVMVEHGKFSPAMKETLSENGIFYCFIDDFYAPVSEDIKGDILSKELAAYFNGVLNLSLHDVLRDALKKTRISMTDEEAERYIRDRIKPRLRAEISKTGMVSLSFRER